MDEEHYVKIKIYPEARFVPPDPVTGQDFRVIPTRFEWTTHSGRLLRVKVGKPITVVRGPALKAGGHGYRYNCPVSWPAGMEIKNKVSSLWFDPRTLEWFVEVPPNAVPKQWELESQVLPFDD